MGAYGISIVQVGKKWQGGLICSCYHAVQIRRSRSEPTIKLPCWKSTRDESNWESGLRTKPLSGEKNVRRLPFAAVLVPPSLLHDRWPTPPI